MPARPPPPQKKEEEKLKFVMIKDIQMHKNQKNIAEYLFMLTRFRICYLKIAII